MSELIKTVVFVVLAAVVGIVAYASLPRTASQDVGDVTNKSLFEDIATEKITRIRIVEFDGVAPVSFEVEKMETGWVLPSEYNYPANKQSQLNNALKFLPDLVVTNVASDREADKEKFGVIEPSEAAENIGQKKIGTLIELIGEGEESLASAVVGLPVKGDEGKSFVLVPGKPHIYVVELNAETLSTDFRDWIDRDLLQIDPYRIAKMSIRRVASATPAADKQTGAIDPGVRHDYLLEAANPRGNWRVERFVDYDQDNQEQVLDASKITIGGERFNELTEQLAELNIANVKRKAPGLAGDVLKDKRYIGATVNQASLRQHGFFVMPGGAAGFQVVSKGGEIVVTMKDGVEYVVRFGDFAQATLDDEGANRYAMISARVNESMLPMPVRGGGEKKDGDEPPRPDDADDENDGATDEQAERAYLRKVQDRKEKLDRANKVVDQLNESYAPWYYIITQDTFEKLTPAQDTLVNE